VAREVNVIFTWKCEGPHSFLVLRLTII
jgi:hypothetical protein